MVKSMNTEKTKLYDRIFKPKVYKLNSGSVMLEKKSRTIPIVIAFIIFSIFSARVTGFKFSTLLKNGHQFNVILGEIFKPNLEYTPSVIGPLLDTIKMSFFGSIVGAALSLPFAYLASTNMVSNKIVNWMVRLLFSILRTIPTLVTALIATYIWGLGTLAGTVAIFVFSFSYVGKLTYEQIETVDMGAFEAMISMGYTKVMAFIKAIIPQILSGFLSTSLYNFEGNVRYAAILGYVGAGGLGLLINENINWRDYNRVGTILLLLLITVFIIEQVSSRLRRRLS